MYVARRICAREDHGVEALRGEDAAVHRPHVGPSAGGGQQADQQLGQHCFTASCYLN